MSAQSGAPWATGAQRLQTSPGTVPSRRRPAAPTSTRLRAASRPHTPARRALALAAATLGAPALAITALLALGVLTDGGEAGLGSLPASQGLQGATVSPAPAASPSRKKHGEEKIASDDRVKDRHLADRTPATQPNPCSKLASASSSAVARSSASCDQGGSLTEGGFTPTKSVPPAQTSPTGPGAPITGSGTTTITSGTGGSGGGSSGGSSGTSGSSGTGG